MDHLLDYEEFPGKLLHQVCHSLYIVLYFSNFVGSYSPL